MCCRFVLHTATTTISVEEIENIAFTFPMEEIDDCYYGIILNGIFNGHVIIFQENVSPVE